MLTVLGFEVWEVGLHGRFWFPWVEEVLDYGRDFTGFSDLRWASLVAAGLMDSSPVCLGISSGGVGWRETRCGVSLWF